MALIYLTVSYLLFRGLQFLVQISLPEWQCSFICLLGQVPLNTIAVVQSHNFQISMVGPILGVIGNALYGFTAALALPAVIVNIVSAFFIFMQHDNKRKE